MDHLVGTGHIIAILMTSYKLGKEHNTYPNLLYTILACMGIACSCDFVTAAHCALISLHRMFMRSWPPNRGRLVIPSILQNILVGNALNNCLCIDSFCNKTQF